MAIIALKAWYLDGYEPLHELEQRPHDLRLNKSSLLKSGLRADFLDDRAAVEAAPWFQRYLAGEAIEFYIEGSGTYAVANLDLASQELYLSKRGGTVHLEPTILFASQTEFPDASDLVRTALDAILARANRRSRFPLTLAESYRPTEGPLRLTATLAGQVRRCLLFVADSTAIARLDGEPPEMVPSPKVSLELGYALACKKPEQVLAVQQVRGTLMGEFPFDLPGPQVLAFKGGRDLPDLLEGAVLRSLERYRLLDE